MTNKNYKKDKNGRDVRVGDYIILFYIDSNREEVVQIEEMDDKPYEKNYFMVTITQKCFKDSSLFIVNPHRRFGLDLKHIERLPRQKNKRKEVLLMKKLAGVSIYIPENL